MKNNIFFLIGPTASGKSKLALRMAQDYPFEIINADIFSFYKGLNIGTAKPSPDDLSKAKHYLIDILETDDDYNVSKFCLDANECIQKILKKGKTPLIVGGSMMYIYQLLHGVTSLESSSKTDQLLIKYILGKYEHKKIYSSLLNYNKNLVININENDSYRIEKALERILYKNDKELNIPGLYNIKQYNIIILFIDITDREKLKKNIDIRTRKMILDGFPDEVRGLSEKFDLNSSIQSMKAIGYQDCLLYLRGEITRDELFNRMTISTHQLAKRQITWKKKFNIQYLVDYPNDKYPKIRQIMETIF